MPVQNQRDVAALAVVGAVVSTWPPLPSTNHDITPGVMSTYCDHATPAFKPSSVEKRLPSPLKKPSYFAQKQTVYGARRVHGSESLAPPVPLRTDIYRHSFSCT